MSLLQQNHVKYGLLFVLVLITCLASMELTGNNKSFDNKSPIFLLYQFIAPAVIWYFGLKAKKKMLKNKMTFKQGVAEGFKMSLVFGLVSPFVFAAYYLFINPDILDYVRTAYQLKDASDAMIIGLDMVAQFFAALAFGTIYAAALSTFLRTKS